jgi:hypothetical protein
VRSGQEDGHVQSTGVFATRKVTVARGQRVDLKKACK